MKGEGAVKALVTGGTGFVGSHVVRCLLEHGHDVRVLHRQTSRLDALAGLTFESVIGDVTDLEALRRASEGVDWVFHVAAVADYWRADRERMFHVNVEGTRYVLQAAREAGVRRVVFTSSAATIGPRDDGLPADENEPLHLPPNRFPYAHSKLQAEQIVAEAVAQGQDVVMVNPVVVMGPGDLNMISGTFITQIKRFQWLVPVTNGGISVIDVRDVARYHLAAAERGETGQRYILMTANYSNRDWFNMIAEVVGAARPRIPAPRFMLPVTAFAIDALRAIGLSTPIDSNQARLGGRYIYFDGSKAHVTFGSPRIDMQQSLRDTYQWYAEHGYIQEDFIARFAARSARLLRMA